MFVTFLLVKPFLQVPAVGAGDAVAGRCLARHRRQLGPQARFQEKADRLAGRALVELTRRAGVDVAQRIEFRRPTWTLIEEDQGAEAADSAQEAQRDDTATIGGRVTLTPRGAR